MTKKNSRVQQHIKNILEFNKFSIQRKMKSGLIEEQGKSNENFKPMNMLDATNSRQEHNQAKRVEPRVVQLNL